MIYLLSTLSVSYILWTLGNKINIPLREKKEDIVVKNRTSNIALHKLLSLDLKNYYYSSCNYSTNNVSNNTAKVKILLNTSNLQVTKAFDSLVGTSEAIRLLNINTLSTHETGKSDNYCSDTLKFKEWLAGLIDADGSLLLSKLGYASLEITMDIRDEHALQIIKNVYGGSIKLRSNSNALRYRLHNKVSLLKIINDINGNIRNSNRLVQLNKICIKYDINLVYPEKLTYNNGWLAGFLDGDGTVTINKSNAQLSISVSQKTSELLTPLIDIYGGNVYIDRGSHQSFKWYITKREDILKLIESCASLKTILQDQLKKLDFT